eukprot:TRINITY_DN11219_c0_g1_i1.p1 TRINITY_DN11219_c0_g1~~TRINITY_DN11219_c0_g1_i1.p1  ORF type:complete len:237 (+),score=34.14 TRINITY_DN11219_c0_g1_i1:244-954(+)
MPEMTIPSIVLPKTRIPQEEVVECEYCSDMIKLSQYEDHILAHEFDLKGSISIRPDQIQAPPEDLERTTRLNRPYPGPLELADSQEIPMSMDQSLQISFRGPPLVEYPIHYEDEEEKEASILIQSEESQIDVEVDHRNIPDLFQEILRLNTLARGMGDEEVDARLEQLASMVMLRQSQDLNQGMSQSSINILPVITYQEDKNEDAECSICASNYEKGDKNRMLRCGHLFHVNCIDE